MQAGAPKAQAVFTADGCFVALHACAQVCARTFASGAHVAGGVSIVVVAGSAVGFLGRDAFAFAVTNWGAVALRSPGVELRLRCQRVQFRGELSKHTFGEVFKLCLGVCLQRCNGKPNKANYDENKLNIF